MTTSRRAIYTFIFALMVGVVIFYLNDRVQRLSSAVQRLSSTIDDRLVRLAGRVDKDQSVPAYFRYASVRITTPYGSGSGVPISEGLALTNCHVLAGLEVGSKVSVDVWIGTMTSSFSADVVTMDEERDLAIVRLPALVRFQCYPKMVDKDPQWGESIFSVGSPSGLEFVPSRGFYCQREEGGTFLISCNGFFGNSGGPILTADGRLVGLSMAMETPEIRNAGRAFIAIAPTFLFHCVSHDQIKAHVREHAKELGPEASEIGK